MKHQAREKKIVKWVQCAGEAHKPGNMSDHCMVCTPYWGNYPTCPDCGHKLLNGVPVGKAFRYWCAFCRQHVWSEK